MKKYFLLPTLLLAVALMVGCSQTETATTETETETTTSTETETAAETVEATSTLWTDEKDTAGIKDAPMEGMLNGQPFTVAYVEIDDWGDEYSWSFSDTQPDGVCGIVIDDNAVSFSSKDLQEGTLKKGMDEDAEFDEYYAYYYYQDEEGWPYSVNTDWSAHIVVDSYEEDYTEDIFGYTVDRVTGWAKIEFGDNLTAVEGSFVADVCDYDF